MLLSSNVDVLERIQAQERRAKMLEDRLGVLGQQIAEMEARERDYVNSVTVQGKKVISSMHECVDEIKAEVRDAKLVLGTYLDIAESKERR